MRSIFPLVAVMVICFTSPTWGAEIKSTRLKCGIVLSGTLDRDTPSALARKLNQVEEAADCKTNLIIQLDSEGGDVDASLRAGRIAREHGALIIVPMDSMCASSCVLLLVGGAHRAALGRIGIHRPYSIDYSSSDRESQRRYDIINVQIQQYLQAMKIPTRLLDAMNSVSPGSIRWLSSAELQDLQITGDDPAIQDRKDSEYAQRLGITKRELYAREQRVRTICGVLRTPTTEAVEKLWKCRNDIIERGR